MSDISSEPTQWIVRWRIRTPGDELYSGWDDDEDDEAFAAFLGDHPPFEVPLPVDFLFPNLDADEKIPLWGERGDCGFVGLPMLESGRIQSTKFTTSTVIAQLLRLEVSPVRLYSSALCGLPPLLGRCCFTKYVFQAASPRLNGLSSDNAFHNLTITLSWTLV